MFGVRTLALAFSAVCAIFPLHALAAQAWPGEQWSDAIDMTSLNPSGWASNLSGACWDSVSRRLWVCTNGPAKFWVLAENGADSFVIEREYNGTGDMEAITLVDTAPGQVFTLDEQGRTLRAYSATDGSLAYSWFFGAIPNWGNSGPEGLAFVPDAWLARSGFADGNGNPYPASVHGADGFGGIMLVAVQTSGWVYAFDLRNDGTYSTVGRYLTSRTESCELAFEASVGRLYILHNIDGNFVEITDLTSSPRDAARAFNTVSEFQVPSGSNIEGFAVTPALTPAHTVGDGWCFFTDDSNANGALRWFQQLPSRLSKEEGDLQQAVTGTPVAIPPSVRAEDAFANPLPEFPITFDVMSGGGTAIGTETLTDEAGAACVGSWTLGIEPGENTLSATGDGLVGSPQLFSAEATPPVPLDSRSLAGAVLAIVLWGGLGISSKKKHGTGL